MSVLQNYIKRSLFIIFLSIFLPLFSIASIVFLIKMAAYTAVVQISLLEMINLFFFMLPELLFYTLPISFFVAVTLMLFKLSNDNEAIVLFSLGIKPKFILKTLFTPALFLSAILFFNFFVLFPHAKVLASNFLSYKKSEAKFNLSASEFGHKFGEWLLYIGKEDLNGTYMDVILFNKKLNEEVLVVAKEAKIINDSGVLRLKLTSGEGYSYSKEKFTQIDFKTMFINDTMQADLDDYLTPMGYWFGEKTSSKTEKKFITNTLLSLFPIIGLFMAASIGIVHIRHQKARVYLFLFASIITYYTLAMSLHFILSFYAIAVLLFGWLGSTYIIYKKSIVAKF